MSDGFDDATTDADDFGMDLGDSQFTSTPLDDVSDTTIEGLADADFITASIDGDMVTLIDVDVDGVADAIYIDSADGTTELVELTAPAGADPVDGGFGGTNSPDGGITVELEGQTSVVGPATEDITGDGVPDAALVPNDEVPGESIAVVDIDHDLQADALLAVDMSTGAVTEGIARDESGDWQPMTDLPGADDVAGTDAAGTAPIGTAPIGTAPIGTAPAGTAPTGTDGITVDMDGQTLEVGPATFDSDPEDSDDRPDTAEIVEGDKSIFVTDSDHDGTGDRITVMAGGDIESDVVQAADGTWGPYGGADAVEPGTAPANADDLPEGGNPRVPTANPTPLPIPPEFADVQPLDDSVPQVTYANAKETLAQQAAMLYSTAFPGQPWPADDAGQPYDPQVLLGVIADDPNVPDHIANQAAGANAAFDRITKSFLGFDQQQ